MAERARHAPNVGLASAGLFSCALLALSCDGDFVNLGTSERMLSGGDAGAGAPNVSGSAQGGSTLHEWEVEPQPVLAQVENVGFANPTLSDAGGLYFTRQVHQGSSPNPQPPLLQLAVMADGKFGPAVSVQVGGAMPSTFAVASPAISRDGTELWLSLLGDSGHTDVYHCTPDGKGWAAPTLVQELSAADGDDAPRPSVLGGTLMPISSKRGDSQLFQIYLAERASADAPWGEPSQALLGHINSPAFQSADGFLSDDGKQLYFSSTRDGDDSNLFVARRSSPTDEFGEPELLLDLKSEYNERMPWLNAEGSVLYFASDRPTPAFQEYAIYRATKL